MSAAAVLKPFGIDLHITDLDPCRESTIICFDIDSRSRALVFTVSR